VSRLGSPPPGARSSAASSARASSIAVSRAALPSTGRVALWLIAESYITDSPSTSFAR
jgi:hypothetical protein